MISSVGLIRWCAGLVGRAVVLQNEFTDPNEVGDFFAHRNTARHLPPSESLMIILLR
jgi:hypothetical protein